MAPEIQGPDAAIVNPPNDTRLLSAPLFPTPPGAAFAGHRPGSVSGPTPVISRYHSNTSSTAIPGSIASQVDGYVPHRVRASGQFGEGLVSSTLSVSAMAMDDVEWGSAEAGVSYRATNPTSQPLGCYFDFTLPAGYVGAGASEVGSSAGLQLGAYRRGPSGVQGYLFEVRLHTTGRQGIDPGAEEYTSDHWIYCDFPHPRCS